MFSPAALQIVKELRKTFGCKFYTVKSYGTYFSPIVEGRGDFVIVVLKWNKKFGKCSKDIHN